MAVGRRAQGGLGRDIGPGTRAIVDDERLPEPTAQPLADQASRRVDAAAWRESDNDAYRFCWVGFGPRKATYVRQHDGRSRQLQ